MTSKVLRAGVIGAGFISVRGHVPGYRSVPKVEVAAICDVKEDRACSVAEELKIPGVYANYRDMLAQEELDLVSVCSPNALHAEMAIAALEAGAHVLCEKPMALAYKDAQAMVAAARRTGKTLTVGFHNRYRPEMAAAKERVAAGELGRVYYAKASMLRRKGIPGYGSWFTNRDLAGGGAMMDIGCHILDLALWFLGHPEPVAVSAATYAEFGPRGKGLGRWGADHHGPGARFDVDDLTTAFVRFENGLILTLEASWATHGTDGTRLQLFGTEAGLEYNDRLFGADEPLHLFGEEDGELTEEPVPVSAAKRSAYEAEISDWVARIRKGQPPNITAEEAAAVVRIVEAAYRSAETGSEIRLV